MERIRIEDIEGPVYITPMSGVALLVYHMFKEQGIEVLGFCDSDESKWGKEYDGCPVMSRESTLPGNSDNVFVVVSCKFNQEIAAELVNIGVQSIIYAQQFMSREICLGARETMLIDGQAAGHLVRYPDKERIEYDALSYCDTMRINFSKEEILYQLVIDTKYYSFELGLSILHSTYEKYSHLQNLVLVTESIENAHKFLEQVMNKGYSVSTLNITLTVAANVSSLAEKLSFAGVPVYRHDTQGLIFLEVNNTSPKKSLLRHINMALLVNEELGCTELERAGGYIFTHIFKNSGTSMQEFLCPGSVMVKYSERLSDIKQKNPVFFDHSFKFTIVRNPWDRLVSIYFYNKRIFKEYGYTNLCDSVQDEIKQQKDYWKLSFKDFVINLGNSYYKNDRFTQQQSYWICDENGNLLTDYIGRFEDLEDSCRYIGERLGIDTSRTIPKLNPSNHCSYQEYYDDEAREIVRKVYKKDIELFGYDFE